MNQIWAPWRVEFIQKEKSKECVFCTLPAQQNDRENLILFRGKSCFVILNRYPYNNGHLMVIPYIHTAKLGDLSPACSSEMMSLADQAMKFLTETMNAQGYNLGFNFGIAAGAGIADHLHLHVVPRWVGDTNFMPVLSDTKVMIEHLMGTFDRLSPLYQSS